MKRICERCRRAFECAAENTLHVCKACAIVFVALAGPHDLPHAHNEPAPPVQTTQVSVVQSSSGSVLDSSGTITWHVPPRSSG